MEKYYKCNKCGQAIAKSTTKPGVCTSSGMMPVRQICGGGLTTELTKEEVIEQFKEWNYTDEQIEKFFE